MQKKYKEKYNEGCLRIFKLLFLLYDDKAYYDDVLEIFKNSSNEQQHVALNKCLNALKVFGIKITKKKNKFRMLNIPFANKYDIGDIKTISLIENFNNNLPKSKVKNEIEDLITKIKKGFDNDTKKIYSQLIDNTENHNNFSYENILSQIEKCETYCQEQYKIQIKYKTTDNNENNCICNAKQVIYDSKTAYLKVYKIKEQEVENIPINNILSINQLPSIKSSTEMPMTIIYKIRGRLAKAYNLKENERLIEVKGDGTLIIANTNEPYDLLLKRLIRYDNNCIIERPKFIREKMKQMINDTLKNYE